DAGAAVLAGRAVGDRLAAAETAVGEEIVELARPLADQMREHLALLVAGQIGARRGRGEVELRGVARVLGHGASRRRFLGPTGARIARRALPVKRLGLLSRPTAPCSGPPPGPRC